MTKFHISNSHQIGKLALVLLLLPSQAWASPDWNAKTVWEELQRRDKGVSQGTISYINQIDTGGNTLVYNFLFSYLADHRYKKAFKSSSKGIASELTESYDGEDYFTSSPGQIVISNKKQSSVPLSVKALVDVMPCPSIPTGRGLSQLSKHSISIKGRWATVKGVGEDNTIIIADVDLKDHFLVRKMERYNSQMALLGNITTLGELANGAIAKTATYRYEGGFRSWKFLSVRFDAPDSHLFTPSFQGGGLTIIDERLGTPIGISKKMVEPVSKKQLLNITRREENRLRQSKNYVELARTIRVFASTFILLLPTLLFSVWLLRKRKKYSTKVDPPS
jgi:hypothetical protein